MSTGDKYVKLVEWWTQTRVSSGVAPSCLTADVMGRTPGPSSRSYARSLTKPCRSTSGGPVSSSTPVWTPVCRRLATHPAGAISHPARGKAGSLGCRLAAVSDTTNFMMVSCILKSMEVHFTPEQQEKLANVAAQQGRGTDELVQRVLARYLEDETTFLEGVEKGIAAAERGEFIEEEEMDARVEQMLKS